MIRPMTRTRAVRVHGFGGSEALQLEEIDTPEPGEGEVLVRVHAAGVNPVDWKVCAGNLQARMPHDLPFVPGWDLAGEVIARGFGARRFDVGDGVFGYIRRPRVQHGAWAERVVVPECYLARKPATLGFSEAAALPLAGLTAYQSLHDAGQLARGERVLVLGASGGVGGFAVQLARVSGAGFVVALASPRNHDYLLDLGAQVALDYTRDDLVDALRMACSEGFDLIVDAVGGELPHRVEPLLRAGGRLVTLIRHDPMPDGWRYVFVEPNARQLEILGAYAAAGLRVDVSTRFPLDRAAEALDAIRTGHTRGKIVLTLDPPAPAPPPDAAV